MNNKLKVKDLVLIGIFAVIYFVGMFAIGMMGLIPILFLVWPFVNGAIMGILVMVFMAKEQKPWTLFIFGILAPLIMFIMGHSYVVLVNGVIVMLLAELTRRADTNLSSTTPSPTVFSQCGRQVLSCRCCWLRRLTWRLP